MTNLEELFEVFNGQDLQQLFDKTDALFKNHLKDRYVDLSESITTVRELVKSLENPTDSFRLSYHGLSLSMKGIQNAFKSGKMDFYQDTVSLIKSEMMHCATEKNLREVKEIYIFWDEFELSLIQIRK